MRGIDSKEQPDGGGDIVARSWRGLKALASPALGSLARAYVRNEIDFTQELNYAPILKAIAETRFTGYVAHEFIPTWPDKLAALRHAVHLCDV